MVLTVPKHIHSLVLALLVVAAVSVSRSSHAIGTIFLDQATLSLGTYEVSLSGIELMGADTTPGELKALLSAGSPEEFQERFKSLTAASLKVGELKQTHRIQGEISTSITRNLEVIGIRNGVATLIRAEGGIFGSSSDVSGTHSGSFGSLILSDVDLPLLIRVNSGRKSVASDTFTRAYSSVTIEKVAFSPVVGPSATIANLNAREVSIKEIDGGFLPLLERLTDRKIDSPELSDADKVSYALDFITLMESIAVSSLDIVGLEIKGTDEIDGTLSVGRVSYADKVGESRATLRFDGFDLTGPDERIQIGSLTHSEFDFAPALKKLRAELSKSGARLDNIDVLNVLPVLGRFELRDAVLDAYQPSRFKAGIRAMTLAYENPDGVFPMGVRWTLDGLFAPFPSDPEDEISQTMIGLGYRDFDLSGLAELRWNDTGTDLAANLAVSAANMGSLSANAHIGGVSQRQMVGDSTTALLSIMAATLKSATIGIENRGLAERMIDQDAVKTKRSSEQVKKAYASVAAASLQLYLGTNETAMRLTRSIVRFIENPSKFSILVRSRNPDGVSIADTTLAEEPGAILDLFDITTSSE